MKVLETDRLTLRWLTPDDAAFVLELLNDPGWLRFIGDKGVRSFEDARHYIAEKFSASYERFGFGLYLTALKSSGAPIGICGLVKRAGLDDVDVGFALLPSYRGNGYTFEAASAVMAYGRSALGLTRIVAITTPDNHSSIRVLEKLGLRFDRMIRLSTDDSEVALYSDDARPDAKPNRAATPRSAPMDPMWKTIIWQQFGAAIDTLENAIVACPEKVWSDRSRRPEFWYVAYHTLFFLDYYLSDSEKGFAPPAPFTLSEMDPAGVLPDRVYTKDELKAYLAHGRTKCRAAISALTDERAHQPCGFERREMNVAELLLYNMRHVQHHAAQLNLMLRQTIDSAPGWVSKAKTKLSDE